MIRTDGGLPIGAASIGPSDGDRSSILRLAQRSIHDLAVRGAVLVLLPELFALPYYAASEPSIWKDMAEEVDGPTVAWAMQISRLENVALVFGLALKAKAGEKPVNAAVLVEPNRSPRVVAKKIHLPPRAETGFGEEDHFQSGSPDIEFFEYESFRFTVLICFDRRFPECWRAAARAGAEVVLIPVAGPAETDPAGQFEAELRTHARANAVFALSSARFGTETVTGRRVRHDGETIAVGPNGERLVSRSPCATDMLIDLRSDVLQTARAYNPTHAHNRLKTI